MAGNTSISNLAVKLVGDVRGYETAMQRASKVTNDTQRNISASLRRTAGATRMMNDSQQMVGRTTNLMGMRMQQAGYQVQDFFVQVGSGTSALRAFAQQAPQFLGVFGPAGAIAGAAVSIGAVVTQMFLATRQTSRASEELKSYADYAHDLRTEMEKIRFDALSPQAQADELRKQIAGITQEIRTMLGAVNTMDTARRQGRFFTGRNLQSILSGFLPGLDFSPAGGRVISETQARIGQLQNELLALQERLKKTSTEIGEAEAEGAKKRFDKLKAEAEAIIDRNLSPLERFQGQINRLQEVFAQRGLLSVEQYNREVARLQGELAGPPAPTTQETLSDRFTRIGLLSGPQQFNRDAENINEQRKQTGILEKVLQVLQQREIQPLQPAAANGFWIS